MGHGMSRKASTRQEMCRDSRGKAAPLLEEPVGITGPRLRQKTWAHGRTSTEERAIEVRVGYYRATGSVSKCEDVQRAESTVGLRNHR